MPGRAALVGGVEAGGTKFVCAVGGGPGRLVAETTIPTTTPSETLERVAAFLTGAGGGGLAAVGVACFGPVDLDPASPTHGWITSTPKPGWAHTDVAGPLARALGVPVALDTDVNAAAVAEHRWGAGRGADPCVYVTVGTGIGGGAIVNGRPVHGALHPEMGHVPVPHDRARDPFAGCCPYHGDCWEGLASAPALRARWGCAPEDLPAGHPAWDLEARYLAAGLATIVGVLSPRVIVLGGGVLRQSGLLAGVGARLREVLAGYVAAPAVAGPGLGERSGVLGAIALALDLASK